MRHELDFSSLPRELQESVLEWVDVKESLRLLAVSRQFRTHVLQNGAFTKTMRSFEIRLRYKEACHDHAIDLKRPNRVNTGVEARARFPPILFHVSTRHFEGVPWWFDGWKCKDLWKTKKIIRTIRFCPQIKISGICMVDGRISPWYLGLNVESFVPRNVRHIGELFFDCPIVHFVDISMALADSRIDTAIVGTSREDFALTSNYCPAEHERLNTMPRGGPLVHIERVIFAPKSYLPDQYHLRLLDLWRPSEVSAIMLGLGGTILRGSGQHLHPIRQPAPIGDWDLFVRWVDIVLKLEKPEYKIELLLPLPDSNCVIELVRRFRSIFGNDVGKTHFLKLHRDDQHFAEPRAQWWLKFGPKTGS